MNRAKKTGTAARTALGRPVDIERAEKIRAAGLMALRADTIANLLDLRARVEQRWRAQSAELDIEDNH